MVEIASQVRADEETWNEQDEGPEQAMDRAGTERALREIAGVSGLNAANGASNGASNGGHNGDRLKTNEWAATLVLVKEACESIRISEERVEALENELEQLTLQSRDDLKKMLARYQAAQEEIKSATARAKAFEARAIEAESWLGRLNEAIVDGFGRPTRSGEHDD